METERLVFMVKIELPLPDDSEVNPGYAQEAKCAFREILEGLGALQQFVTVVRASVHRGSTRGLVLLVTVKYKNGEDQASYSAGIPFSAKDVPPSKAKMVQSLQSPLLDRIRKFLDATARGKR